MGLPDVRGGNLRGSDPSAVFHPRHRNRQFFDTLLGSGGAMLELERVLIPPGFANILFGKMQRVPERLRVIDRTLLDGCPVPWPV